MSAELSTVKDGACLCGAIKLHIEGPPVMTSLCHCTSCQKSSGSIFASLAVYKDEQLVVTTTDPTVLHTYRDAAAESGAVLLRSFCGTCGSRIKNSSDRAKGFTVVPTGVIDGDKDDLKPGVELYCIHRSGWLGEVEGSTKLKTMT